MATTIVLIICILMVIGMISFDIYFSLVFNKPDKPGKSANSSDKKTGTH